MQRVLIITTVSPDGVEPILDAVAASGGGKIGHYTHCAFTSSGFGRFKASAEAQPHVGTKNTINQEAEVRIETFCSRADAKAVVAAIRSAHPYEEPVIYVVPVIEETDL